LTTELFRKAGHFDLHPCIIYRGSETENTMRVKYSDWLDIRSFYDAVFPDKKERRIKIHNTDLVTR